MIPAEAEIFWGDIIFHLRGQHELFDENDSASLKCVPTFCKIKYGDNKRPIFSVTDILANFMSKG
jgi:hypothetical protein